MGCGLMGDGDSEGVGRKSLKLCTYYLLPFILMCSIKAQLRPLTLYSFPNFYIGRIRTNQDFYLIVEKAFDTY